MICAQWVNFHIELSQGTYGQANFSFKSRFAPKNVCAQSLAWPPWPRTWLAAHPIHISSTFRGTCRRASPWRCCLFHATDKHCVTDKRTYWIIDNIYYFHSFLSCLLLSSFIDIILFFFFLILLSVSLLIKWKLPY